MIMLKGPGAKTIDGKPMRGSIKFCQWGPTFTTFFFVNGGREDPNTTKSGPSSARKRYAIKKWPFAGGLLMAQH